MNTDIRSWTQSCRQCQQSKVHWHTVTPLSTLQTRMPVFPKFTSISSNRYHTLADIRTCWCALTALHAGLPHATHHCRSSFTDVCERLGCEVRSTKFCHHRSRTPIRVPAMVTTNPVAGMQSFANHSISPNHNGIVERFHRQLKSSLKAHAASTHWVEALPLVLLSIRTVVKSDLQCSVVELIYGTTLRLPGEVIQKDTPHTVTDPAEMSCITSRHPQFAHCLSGMSTSAQALHHVRTFLFATMESTNLWQWSVSCYKKGRKILDYRLQWPQRHSVAWPPETCLPGIRTTTRPAAHRYRITNTSHSLWKTDTFCGPVSVCRSLNSLDGGVM